MRTLTTWQELQLLLTVNEAVDLDFKETMDPKASDFAVEARKDIAALANTLGGHLVVGASTEMNRSRCTGFHGIPPELAASLVSLLEAQAREHCRPAPMLSSRVIDVPEKTTKVLVLAVGMSPVAPVGASLRQDSGGHRVDKGWCFPYRVGSQTEYLTPDQFGAYESMSARRAAALLNGIPAAERSNLCIGWDGGSENQVSLVEVRLDLNVANFESTRGSLGTVRGPFDQKRGVPLDQVVTVWRDSDQWIVSLRGEVTTGGTYWPARR